LPVIMMTGKSQEEVAAAAAAAGACEVLTKPFDLGLLEGLISRHLPAGGK